MIALTIGVASCYYDSDERINISIKNECNLDNVTYETCVKSIMDNNCKGCHSASNASGGIKLDTYANTKASYNISMTAINNGTMPQLEDGKKVVKFSRSESDPDSVLFNRYEDGTEDHQIIMTMDYTSE